MRTINTDLALEAHEYYVGDAPKSDLPDGIETENSRQNNINITHVRITNENGEKLLQKKKGNYITLEIENISPDFTDETAETVLSRHISSMLRQHSVKPDAPIFVVGLGNKDITPDALGPKTVSKLDITRHLFEFLPSALEKNQRSVCAVAPGVLGNTGIETGEIVQAVCEKIKPAAVIVIDALASRSTKRVGKTIQLADTGIHPGSGVGNRRKGITADLTGVPVIALGVPTVVNAATIADDAIDQTMRSMHEFGAGDYTGVMSELEDDERYRLIHHTLGDMADMMVTPKEIDNIISGISSVVANGINMGLKIP